MDDGTPASKALGAWPAIPSKILAVDGIHVTEYRMLEPLSGILAGGILHIRQGASMEDILSFFEVPEITTVPVKMALW